MDHLIVPFISSFSFCKGKSLYSSIYEFRQKFQFSKTVYIASQIAQVSKIYSLSPVLILIHTSCCHFFSFKPISL